MRHLDLFSGIGGFALAAQMVWGDDYENIAFCDNNEFCQEALRKNFPGCTIIGDVREVTKDTIYARLQGAQEQGRIGNEWNNSAGDGIGIHLLTGGFPCQPFSCAGKRQGQADDRYLWPEMLRVISEFQPRWVIGENVAGFVEMALHQVQADLEGEGYEVGSFIIPACAVNAPHRRDRVWIVAHRNDTGERTSAGGTSTKRKAQSTERGNAQHGTIRPDSDAADTEGARLEGRDAAGNGCAGGRLAEYAINAVTDSQSARCKARGNDGMGTGQSQSTTLAYPDWTRDWREVAFATCFCGVDDGLPRRLVRLPSGRTISRARWRTEALKAYGNAIVPAVAAEIMKAIKEAQ